MADGHGTPVAWDVSKQPLMATPATTGGMLILRSQSYAYAVAEPAAPGRKGE